MIDGYAVCDNEIIIDGRIEYVILDTTGNVQKRIRKKDLQFEKKYPGYTIDRIKAMSLINFIVFPFNCKQNELYIPVFNTKTKDLHEKYKGYAVTSLNIETEDISLLPISYPDIFKQGDSFGNLHDMQLTIKGDSLIYNFPNTSDIFIYNKLTGKTENINVASYCTRNISETLNENTDSQKTMYHYTHALFFHEVIFDQYRNLFYRLHVDKCDNNNFFEGRKVFLTIMNEQLERLDEVEIPSTLYPVYHVVEDGIMFRTLKNEEEDYFTYVIISFDKANPKQLLSVSNKLESDSFVVKKGRSNSDSLKHEPLKKKKLKDITQFPMDKNISMQLVEEFISANLRYPENALKNKEEGIVQILFRFDSTGKVTDSRMLYGCNNSEMETEALRVIQLIKQVKTDKEGGFGIPVVFDLKKWKQK